MQCDDAEGDHLADRLAQPERDAHAETAEGVERGKGGAAAHLRMRALIVSHQLWSGGGVVQMGGAVRCGLSAVGCVRCILT